MKRKMVANRNTTLFTLNWEGHETFPVNDFCGGREDALAGTAEAGLAVHRAGAHEGLGTRQVTDDVPLNVELPWNCECNRDSRNQAPIADSRAVGKIISFVKQARFGCRDSACGPANAESTDFFGFSA